MSVKRRLFLFLGSAALAGAAAQEGGAKPVPADVLVRPHSPILGAPAGRVTIVEFFDPLCEACRAFHPQVKQILAAHPGRVRLVIRYALFHKGSDVAVGILEMARRQGKYETILEALLARQPEWAIHGAPNLALAWRIAQGAGLDISDARQREVLAGLERVLRQDVADCNALQIEGTPTFYVDGIRVGSVGGEGLRERVAAAVALAQSRAPAAR